MCFYAATLDFFFNLSLFFLIIKQDGIDIDDCHFEKCEKKSLNMPFTGPVLLPNIHYSTVHALIECIVCIITLLSNPKCTLMSWATKN